MRREEQRRIQYGMAVVLVCTIALMLRAPVPGLTAPLTPVPTADPAAIATPTSTASTVAAPTVVATTPPPTPRVQIAADAPPNFSHGFDQTRYYTVKPGDTLLDVAVEVGIDLERMHCVIAPDFVWEKPLVIGDVLEIPPVDVACHAVQPGETLAAIAAQYGATAVQIAALPWNRLSSSEQPLTPGHHLRIPPPDLDAAAAGQELAHLLAQPVDSAPLISFPVGGPYAAAPERHMVPDDWPYGSGYFRWPTYGWLSQGYHARHRAVDIAAQPGTPVTAADRGIVVRAGWNNQGYGNFVVIDHNIDFVTLYAHLSEIFVSEGQVVAPGEPLGTVGSTGNSTGPHLHFEIRDFGHLIDPLGKLAP